MRAHRARSCHSALLSSPGGLFLWLNSIYVGEWFCGVSGSTPVNAGDIKTMPCLPLDNLEKIGVLWKPRMAQATIDEVARGSDEPEDSDRANA